MHVRNATDETTNRLQDADVRKVQCFVMFCKGQKCHIRENKGLPDVFSWNGICSVLQFTPGFRNGSELVLEIAIFHLCKKVTTLFCFDGILNPPGSMPATDQDQSANLRNASSKQGKIMRRWQSSWTWCHCKPSKGRTTMLYPNVPFHTSSFPYRSPLWLQLPARAETGEGGDSIAWRLLHRRVSVWCKGQKRANIC